MKIFLSDQSDHFRFHLDLFTKSQVMPYDKSDLKEKMTSIDLKTGKTIEELDLQFLFDYKIFPDKIMSYLTQWRPENRQMKVGDTIIQQAYLPPVKGVSVKLLMGVRINEIFNEPTKKGFSYETLAGHVEKGISIFTAEQLGARLLFKIHTFSRPGNTLTKLAGPLFSVPYQTYCTRMALLNIKRQAEQPDFELVNRI